MDSSHTSMDALVEKEKEASFASTVDPFLIEALQNPRHRLTILRMELDVQRFLQNPNQLQFEFQHFPTSYLRLAAHRVAQHYGLQTMVLDNVLDGPGTKIAVRKTAESRYPPVFLSEIPAKHLEICKHEQVKIAIRPKPNRTFNDATELGIKRSPARTEKERKEEYDRARARIFSSPSSCSSDDTLSQASADGKFSSSSKDDSGRCWASMTDSEKNLGIRDIGSASRVAIFRDREKDRFDPDYDRTYERYVKSIPTGPRLLAPFNMPKFQPPFVQYNPAFPQLGQIPRAQSCLNYGPSSDTTMSHFASMDATYMQWPSPTMMYAHTHEPLRHAFFQAPFCQRPLSFDYSQNHS
ncbi:hypothetical protein Nepgr_022064 [Nepenthes gracilis]|uniref:Uncharacterized protein n=1 Tax=Nepenthes gracilis TaxID=150966 RepID=A0AAD3SXX3_NEPGR|nr:hypothetical protein Nepgr_022064 [Nepenthes gracilis]